MYYEHTPEWWGQAIWFYNKINKAEIPQDVFEVVERAGSEEGIPPVYLDYSKAVLQYWGANERLAELCLPTK